MICEVINGRKTLVTDERLDALQDEVAGDAARQVLTELCYEFGVAFVLLPQQVKLLLLVTKKKKKSHISRCTELTEQCESFH